jgi:hypothetical protein
MALQPALRRGFGFAASLSGYFTPGRNQLANGASADPFNGNQALRRQNTPLDAFQFLKPGTIIPQFWLGAGKGDRTALNDAQYLAQVLQIYQANVPVVLSPGQHTMAVWRAEIPPMLAWMTKGLAYNVTRYARNVRLATEHSPACGKPTSPPTGVLETRAKPSPAASPSARSGPDPRAHAGCAGKLAARPRPSPSTKARPKTSLPARA